MRSYSKNSTIRTFGFEKRKNEKFYQLLIGYKNKYAELSSENCDTPTSLIECECGNSVNMISLFTSRFSFIGKKEADIYEFPGHIVAGKKVISLLKENEIVGFKLLDIDIEDRGRIEQKHIEELREIEIVGRCYRIFSADGQEIEHCPFCTAIGFEGYMKIANGLKIVEEYWDGSDIFEFNYGVGYTIVTERVKKLFEENEVNNVDFRLLEDIKIQRYLE